MKAIDLKLITEDKTFSANYYPAGSHYNDIMMLGRMFPATKAQAIRFIKSGLRLDVLNSKDVDVVESMLNKHGFVGNYKYTKSKELVRLQNLLDLKAALKKEFSI